MAKDGEEKGRDAKDRSAADRARDDRAGDDRAEGERAEGERGWRGSVEGWLEGARLCWSRVGFEAVKIGPLAARLGLSRTSFYWHSPDREALLAGLVARWQGAHTALLAQIEAPAATVTAAILNLFTTANDALDAWVEPAVLIPGRIRHADLGSRTDPAAGARWPPRMPPEVALTAMSTRYGYDLPKRMPAPARSI
ncbi:MAG: TetR/AcrR family transcriptional regulator [Paracoccaceae bacterium]